MHSSLDQCTRWAESNYLGVELLALVFSWLDGRVWLRPLLARHLDGRPLASRYLCQSAYPPAAAVDPLVEPPALDWPVPLVVDCPRCPREQSPINRAISG